MVNENLQNSEQQAKKAKVMTVVTYSLVLLFMFAGLFVPLFDISGSSSIMDKMLLKYIPGIFNALLYPIAKKAIIPLPENGFFIALPNSSSFSPEMLALAFYVILCVVALFMLIPVLLGKREKRTSAICAYVIELLTLLSVGYFVLAALNVYVSGGVWICYNLVIVLGGVFIMMCVQSIYNKGGLGITKIILMLLSALIVFFLFDLNAISPALGKVFNPISKGVFQEGTAAFTHGTDYSKGISALKFFKYFSSSLPVLEKSFYVFAGILVCLCIFNLVYDSFEIIVGTKLDKEGMPHKHELMSAVAISRYIIALLLAITTMVLALIMNGAKPGVYFFIILVIIFIQLIITIVRAAILAAKSAKARKAADEKENEENSEQSGAVAAQTNESEETPMNEELNEEPEFEEYSEGEGETAEQTEETPVEEQAAELQEEPVEEQSAGIAPAPMVYNYNPEPEQQPEEEVEQLVIPGTPEPESEEEPEPMYGYAPQSKTEDRTYVYNYRAVYNGPSDTFMDTLDDAEKIEFVQVFLEKTKGRVKGIPEYRIGQDNSMFFPSVFIHINRTRELISTHLLEKIYKQIGKD